MALSLADIERLAALVSAERLDALEYDGVRITKSLHAPLVEHATARAKPDSDEDDDDLLYASSDP